jgi:hypothetical protein
VCETLESCMHASLHAYLLTRIYYQIQQGQLGALKPPFAKVMCDKKSNCWAASEGEISGWSSAAAAAVVAVVVLEDSQGNGGTTATAAL